MKQTAVDWLISQLEEYIRKSAHNELGTTRGGDFRIGLRKAIDFCEQAKAMEKEQIVKAIDSIQLVSRRYYKDGTDWKYWDDVLGWEVPTSDENEYFGLSITGEKYYKQTYGTK